MPTSIRSVSLDDAEAIAAHRARDDRANASWEPLLAAELRTPEGQRARIARLLALLERGEAWPGVIVAGGQVIGQITVNTIVRGPVQQGSLGYWVGTPHQAAGHAGDAVGLVLELMRGELGLHRAEASTQLDNVASQKVLRRNGFSAVGVLHQHLQIQGEWRDSLLWERVL